MCAGSGHILLSASHFSLWHQPVSDIPLCLSWCFNDKAGARPAAVLGNGLFQKSCIGLSRRELPAWQLVWFRDMALLHLYRDSPCIFICGCQAAMVTTFGVKLYENKLHICCFVRRFVLPCCCCFFASYLNKQIENANLCMSSRVFPWTDFKTTSIFLFWSVNYNLTSVYVI